MGMRCKGKRISKEKSILVCLDIILESPIWRQCNTSPNAYYTYVYFCKYSGARFIHSLFFSMQFVAKHKPFELICLQILTSSCDPPRIGWNLGVFVLLHFVFTSIQPFYDSFEVEAGSACPPLSQSLFLSVSFLN